MTSPIDHLHLSLFPLEEWLFFFFCTNSTFLLLMFFSQQPPLDYLGHNSFIEKKIENYMPFYKV